ncbi:hypothetical protein BJX64DRAFT_256092 [Aspergillus heterothallicus]
MESNSKRQAQLSTAERKRLTDRKAQRQRRERIKTYIARLEKTLEELTAASGNGMEATLLKQLEQQRSKTERLTNVINHIHEVLEETRSSSSPGPEPSSPLLTQGESSASAAATAAASAPTSAPTSASASSAAVASAMAAASIPRLISHSNPLEPQAHRPPTFTISVDLLTKISLHSQNPSNSGTRNYFQVVNESISNVAKERNSILPSTMEDDDDLAIRVALYGWDSIRTGGRNLDRVWGLLQALDQGIFSRTGLVERAAILRLMRSMIKWQLSQHQHDNSQSPIPSIPPFMFPTVTQTMVPHAPIIDFFAWPNLRDHLIVSGITNITETTATLYVSQIRIKWPYELRDICKYNVSEDRYRFSSEFDAAYYDLNSWTIGSGPLQMLIENGPSMAGLDPSAVGAQGAPGENADGEVDAGSYWDRLLDSCDQM